jgi:hypothetical protein
VEGFFRNAEAKYIGFLAQYLGHGSLVLAELYAAILTVQIAYTKGWNKL